mmetsp:Transcript_3156/g.5080  ORF Transcript_3156/g.5080 Transcript_3156/m.5080 type:complete len:136 (+) Transcript_3156:402-809(+)
MPQAPNLKTPTLRATKFGDLRGRNPQTPNPKPQTLSLKLQTTSSELKISGWISDSQVLSRAFWTKKEGFNHSPSFKDRSTLLETRKRNLLFGHIQAFPAHDVVPPTAIQFRPRTFSTRGSTAGPPANQPDPHHRV